MPTPFIDPADAEEVLEDCLAEVDFDADAFTDWEIEFLESLERHLEESAITEDQWTKLQQIYRERIGE